MPSLLEKKANELDEIISAARDIEERASREDRGLTDLERERVATLGDARDKLIGECEFLQGQRESERNWAQLRSAIDRHREQEAVDAPGRPGEGPRGPRTGPLEVRGWGDTFVESEAFKAYPGAGTSGRVSVPLNLERRAAISIGGFPPEALPPFMYSPAQFQYATPLLDSVGRVTTGSNSVSWVQWAPNPQAAAGVVLEGELKPEAVMTPTAQTAALETLAHWKGITRQALEDIPQIRSIVENRLRQGILVALETAVITALTAATIPPVTGSAAGGDTLLALIRVGIATVQAAGYARPNAILINPNDAAAIDVAMLAGTLNGPVVNGTYWGVPIIPVTTVPEGTAYVGDMSVAVQLFTRSNTEVYMTDSHADYFIRNVLLLLAEQRALVTVPDPAALVEVTLGV